MIKLKLYSTLGCHLCEHAEAVLDEVAKHCAIEWQVVEIASDPRLIDQYGIRIPVVKAEHSQLELGWPFDVASFYEWLECQSLNEASSH